MGDHDLYSGLIRPHILHHSVHEAVSSVTVELTGADKTKMVATINAAGNFNSAKSVKTPYTGAGDLGGRKEVPHHEGQADERRLQPLSHPGGHPAAERQAARHAGPRDGAMTSGRLLAK